MTGTTTIKPWYADWLDYASDQLKDFNFTINVLDDDMWRRLIKPGSEAAGIIDDITTEVIEIYKRIDWPYTALNDD